MMSNGDLSGDDTSVTGMSATGQLSPHRAQQRDTPDLRDSGNSLGEIPALDHGDELLPAAGRKDKDAVIRIARGAHSD
jgi:hypothetical protein